MHPFEIDVEDNHLIIKWKIKIRKKKGFWICSLLDLPISAAAEYKGQVIADLIDNATEFFVKMRKHELERLGFDS